MRALVVAVLPERAADGTTSDQTLQALHEQDYSGSSWSGGDFGGGGGGDFGGGSF